MTLVSIVMIAVPAEAARSLPQQHGPARSGRHGAKASAPLTEARGVPNSNASEAVAGGPAGSRPRRLSIAATTFGGSTARLPM